MNFHRVRSVKVVRHGNNWTAINIVRQENADVSEEDVKLIAEQLSMEEHAVWEVVSMFRKIGTFEEEVSLFPEDGNAIKWEFE